MKRPKVFMGGTCNESTWRKELIPLLRIDYCNPVVNDWTPEAQAEELHQRALCDFILYVITPKMTGVYSIAEAVDDSNKRPRETVFCVLKEDGELRFTEDQLRSLIAVAAMIRRNCGCTFDRLQDCAEFLNSKIVCAQTLVTDGR